MAVRSDTFRVVFDVLDNGTIKASFADVAKAATDTGRAVDDSGDKWEAFGRKIGTSLKWAGGIAAAGIALIVKNTMQAEQELAQLDAILRSTGNAAGYSRDQLVSMANELSKNSVFSGGEIIEAQTRLLSYSGIMGENIPRAMQAVIDQSARLGISVSQSAETIGRALESPSKAAAALAQQGFGAAFTEEVRKTIKALEEQGREAEAQQMVLEILEESYAGAAQAQRDTFGGALIALKKTLADVTTGSDGSLDGATTAVNDLIDTLNDPQVRQGFASIVDGVLDVLGAAAQAIPVLIKFNEELAKGYGIGQSGTTRAGNIGDFLAGNVDFWRDAMRGEFNSGANARIRAGFTGGQIANFANVTGGVVDSTSAARYQGLPEDFGLGVNPNGRPTGGGSGGGGGKGRSRLSDQEREAQALARAYEAYNSQLHRSNELFGEQSELARVNYEIQFGALKGLDPVMADNLRSQAEWLDMQEQIAEHEEIVARAREEHEEVIRRQQEATAELIDSLRLELELMGMSRSEAQALLAIRRLGIDETSAEAAEIRSLYAAIEDNERAIQAMDEVRAAGSGLLVDLGMGKNPLEAAENALARLHERLLQMVADKLIEQIFGSYGSTGEGTSSGGWLSSIFGAMFGGGLAFGGTTRPNMLYEINEMGAPEVYRGANGKSWMLTGNEHGEVVPMGGYAGAGGGDTYHVNVNLPREARPRTANQTANEVARTLSMAQRLRG